MKKKKDPKNTQTREIELESGSQIKPQELDLSEERSREKSKAEKKSIKDKRK